MKVSQGVYKSDIKINSDNKSDKNKDEMLAPEHLNT